MSQIAVANPEMFLKKTGVETECFAGFLSGLALHLRLSFAVF